MSPKLRVLFLCTGNSCRSQMAEGWARALKSDIIEAESAGIEKHGLNPFAVKVMAEAGVDISGHKSKTVDELADRRFDFVVTVCGHAHETCPVFPGRGRIVHVPFDDPPKLARDARSEEEALGHYRRVRDEIRAFVASLPEALEASVTKGVQQVKHDQSEFERDAVRQTVSKAYGQIAKGESKGCCGKSASCCGTSSADALARSLGYADTELASLPEGANMGLSCGNPTVLASLRPGETVLDLGSGGGFDVFIAARKVGPTGRAIGVDMTPEMVHKARRNVAAFRERTGLANVEFRLGEIEHLPVADAGVDVVISNCVINLSPDKPQVWREVFRVLKPGGRAAVSDLALLRPVPPALLEQVEALVGCIAGAVLTADTRAMLRDAGFRDVRITQKPGAVESMFEVNDPLYRAVMDLLPPGARLSDYVASVDIAAVKPADAAAGAGSVRTREQEGGNR